MASFSVCYYHRKLNNQLFISEGKKTGNFQNSLLLWFTEKYELVIDHLFCALHNMTMIDFEVFYISAKSLKLALIKRPSSFIYISFSEVKCWCFITYKNKLKLCVYRLSNKVFVISMELDMGPYIFSSVSIFTLPSFQSTVEFNDLKPFVCKTCLTILFS